jgi:hypothetical protein
VNQDFHLGRLAAIDYTSNHLRGEGKGMMVHSRGPAAKSRINHG